MQHLHACLQPTRAFNAASLAQFLCRLAHLDVNPRTRRNAELLPTITILTAHTSHEVLYLPAEQQAEDGPLLGHVHLQGCLTGLAFVLPSTSAAEAVQLLKVHTTGFCMITSLPTLCPLNGRLSADGLSLGSATAISEHPLLHSILVYSLSAVGCCSG